MHIADIIFVFPGVLPSAVSAALRLAPRLFMENPSGVRLLGGTKNLRGVRKFCDFVLRMARMSTDAQQVETRRPFHPPGEGPDRNNLLIIREIRAIRG